MAVVGIVKVVLWWLMWLFVVVVAVGIGARSVYCCSLLLVVACCCLLLLVVACCCLLLLVVACCC